MSTPGLTASGVRAVVEAASGRRMAVVEHALDRGVVATAESVEQVVSQLPTGWLRGVDGAVDAVTAVPSAELGPVLPHQRSEPTVTRIYHLQRSPVFRPLTDAVYDPLEAAWPEAEPWLERDAGFFLSSDGAVTSAHCDRHHNLLLQLTGRKEIGVVLPGSPAHARAVARSLPLLRVDPLPEPAVVITLEPGQALYLPPYAIHWVRSLGETTALSCGWSSADTVAAGERHAANGVLARAGVPLAVRGRVSGRMAVAAVGTARRVRRRKG